MVSKNEVEIEILNKKIGKHATLLWRCKTVYHDLESISVSQNGPYIIAGSGDGKVYFFNQEGKLLWSYDTGDNSIVFFAVSISRDGTYVAAGSGDGKVYFFNQEGKLLWSYDTGFVRCVSVSRDGSHVAAGSYDGKVYFFNREGKLLWSYDTAGSKVNGFSVSQDGSCVAAGIFDEVCLFNQEGKLLWSYKEDGSANISVSFDGSYIAASSGDKVYFFNRVGKLLWSHRTGDSVFGDIVSDICVSSNGSYIVAGSEEGKVYFFNLGGKLLWSHEIGDGYVGGVSVSSDGSYIAALSEDNTIYLFKCETEFLKAEIEKINATERAGREALENLVTIMLPDTVNYGTEIEVKIDANNTFNEPVKALSLDFSEASEYFKLSERVIKFPTLKSGMQLSRPIKLRPLFVGEYSFSVKIKSSFGVETKDFTGKVVRVKGGEILTPVEFTPHQTTSSISPTELQDKFDAFLHWREPFFGGTVSQWKELRQDVYTNYRRIFDPSTLENMTEEDFQSFLDFNVNKSWTGLRRRGMEATRDMPKLRETIAFLLNESIDIKTRINEVLKGNGRYKIAGMGKNLATAILHVFKPDKYAIWNNRVEDALKKFGLLPRLSGDLGEHYLKLNQVLTDLKTKLNTDLTTVDMFMYYISSLFEKKEYERDLGKYQESFRKNIDARNGAEKLNNENTYYNKPKDADKIREYILNELIETAHATGDTILKIRSGDIGKKLGLYGRMPNVCQVLHGKKLQELCSIKLLNVEGPEPSTTTVYTFEIMIKEACKNALGISYVDSRADIFKVTSEGEPEIPIEKNEIALTIERAIYDPCKRDFIESALPRMKEWINHYDPGAYWFAISIQNNTDKAIEEWDVDLEFSSALKIGEAKIEGIEREIPRETHLKSFKISVPREYGLVIPKGGVHRVYFMLRAELPKTQYVIKGVFKSNVTGDVPIRAKEFKYLCDVGVSPKAVGVELEKTFPKKDAARLALSFKTVQELERMCNHDAKTVEYIDKLLALKNYTEGFSDKFRKHVDEFSRFMEQEQGEYLQDEYKGKVKRFCTNLVDVWISEFLKG
jgi:outer membrane protein assembly factor BamB/thermostable 8-oxoguanine DNA glycosylase